MAEAFQPTETLRPATKKIRGTLGLAGSPEPHHHRDKDGDSTERENQGINSGKHGTFKGTLVGSRASGQWALQSFQI